MRPVTKYEVSEHHCALAGAPTVLPVPYLGAGQLYCYTIHLQENLNVAWVGENKNLFSSSKHITANSHFATYV